MIFLNLHAWVCQQSKESNHIMFVKSEKVFSSSVWLMGDRVIGDRCDQSVCVCVRVKLF